MTKEIKLLIFTLLSLIAIILSLVLCKKKIKNEKTKDYIFFIVSI